MAKGKFSDGYFRFIIEKLREVNLETNSTDTKI